MAGNQLEEAFAERLALPRAYTLDLQEGDVGDGLEPRHLAQGGVAEDNVGRHPALLGQSATQCTERLEEIAVLAALRYPPFRVARLWLNALRRFRDPAQG